MNQIIGELQLSDLSQFIFLESCSRRESNSERFQDISTCKFQDDWHAYQSPESAAFVFLIKTIKKKPHYRFNDLISISSSDTDSQNLLFLIISCMVLGPWHRLKQHSTEIIHYIRRRWLRSISLLHNFDQSKSFYVHVLLKMWTDCCCVQETT